MSRWFKGDKDQVRELTQQMGMEILGYIPEDDTVNYNDAGWFGRTEMVRGLGRLPALNASIFPPA